jgi:GNAT superfamily N-acetyltransferase
MTQPPDIRRLEAAMLASWPAITTGMDGTWIARFARGYTRRSNSVNCLDPADDADAEARIERMARLYQLNRCDPIFRVTPLCGPELVAALEAGGWRREGASRVLVLPLAGDYPELADVRTYDPTDSNWLEALGALVGTDARAFAILARLVGLIAHHDAGLLIRDAAGEPAAAALAVDAAGIGAYHNVIVRADLRGKGLGRAIMHAGLNWARAAGCVTAALQVEAGNAPAVRLYQSLGFEQAYDYHYRRL